MTGLAITCFLIGAALLFFAFQPRLAFFLDEGWKFKNETEPSDAYVGLNFIGRLGAGVVAIVMGGVLLGQSGHVDAQDAALAAAHRCRETVLPRFDDTIEWNGSRVADPDELRALATELGVEVNIAADYAIDGQGPTGDAVEVLDPNRPGTDKVVFRYLGAYHDQYWARPVTCESYLNGSAA